MRCSDKKKKPPRVLTPEEIAKKEAKAQVRREAAAKKEELRKHKLKLKLMSKAEKEVACLDADLLMTHWFKAEKERVKEEKKRERERLREEKKAEREEAKRVSYCPCGVVMIHVVW